MIGFELVTHLLNTAATEFQPHVHWDICLQVEKHNVQQSGVNPFLVRQIQM